MATNDGSEDVNDFLLRIRELGDQRDREDEERTRKLEEEIIQGRKERQARRAERARSISPTKEPSSNAGTPTSIRSTADNAMNGDIAKSPITFVPSNLSLEEVTGECSRNLHEGPSKENRPLAPRDLPQAPLKPAMLGNTSPSGAVPLSRSSTLSWQQRPTSRGSTGPRARPLSQIAAENSTSRSPRASLEPPSAGEREMSRNQIAESLSSKDPAWFRQTHERGLGSAAYRRNQEESMPDTASMTGSMRLPGMSRESTVEPERQGSPVSESVRSLSPSRTDPIRSGSVRQSKYTSSSTVSSPDGARLSIPNLVSPILESPASNASSAIKDLPFSRGMAMSPSQGRMSPERLDRPSSPTKGLGGFVQSAMLKRSDSVNKRWSAQPGTGLSRGNSIASNRSGYGGSREGIPNLSAHKEQTPTTSSRETSPMASSRPSSSQTTATITQPGKEGNKPPPPAFTKAAGQTPVPDVEAVQLVRSHEVLPSNLPEPEVDMKPDPATRSSPPSSPSKRWSPTKSSWLENAINKPDSPKPKMPPPGQPPWMANISQAKQQRGSVDLTKGSNFKEVSTSGLLRSPPMGSANKPPNIGGLPPSFSGTAKSRTQRDDPFSKPSENQASQAHDIDGIRSAVEPQPELFGVRQLTHPISPKAEQMTSASPKSLRDGTAAGIRGTPDSSPRSSKSKPETPPKKDFRSNLKPRQISGEKRTTEDPEFKNVFGKLKRTQTQNYVAPDELKDNILRGKAGLAITGGPKKTERRDEFKDSLLKQKEAMKAGSPPSVGRKLSAGDSNKNRTPSTPEALAKRNDLTRSESNSTMTKGETAKTEQQPEALARFKSLRGKPQLTSSEVPAQEPAKPQKTSFVNGRLGPDFNSSLAGVLSRGPAPLQGGTRSAQNVVSEDDKADDAPSGQNAAPEAVEVPQLTHMTKSRARGPKRRLPKTSTVPEQPDPQPNSEPTKANATLTPTKLRSESKPQVRSPSIVKSNPQSRPLVSISHNHRKPSQPQPPRKPSLNVHNFEVSSPLPPNTKNNPVQPTSPHLSSPPATKPKPLSPEYEPAKQHLPSSPKISNAPETPQQQIREENSVDYQTKTAQAEHLPEAENPLPSVKGVAALWDQSSRQERPSQTRARSPIKLPNRKDEEAAMKGAGLIPEEETPIGLGINSIKQEPRISTSAIHDLPTPPLSSPKSPPIPAKKPPSIANRVVSTTANGGPASKVNGSSRPVPSEATRLFAELFDESQATELNVNINTPAVLASRVSSSQPDKIRTLRKQLWEVTGGGKLIPVPSDQSHILFEDSLYICHHVFGSLAGTRSTEIYLWCGDGVATAAVEDAHVFARKEAKDRGGKLVVVQQGKETWNFFQALGGIVITRHGQSDRASSRYILCGRRHVGQIAFDEVDFSPSSLCKGFPYIISSGMGKIRIWKGIGSGVDELGCARLIGMDLGLGGEIEEIEDGKEPDAFWDLFRDGAQQQPHNTSQSPSNHWHLKPSNEQYATRLYQVDIETPRPKSSGSFWGRRGSAPASTPTDEHAPKWNAMIKEIIPFAQSDVFHDGVFVLDTFFEVFVILPSFPSTSLLLPSFRTACIFAQEYAILAASSANENRPFVPQGYVLLLGVGRDAVPEGVRVAFRKWDAGKVRGCRVLGLVESLEALTAGGKG
ncbi:MAG: hypothetical protein LQ338_003393 [Usnochroma carphineum]|nr:MAG: hypothetical protein LQ338_003393 [Usnochroma carphineum]